MGYGGIQETSSADDFCGTIRVPVPPDFEQTAIVESPRQGLRTQLTLPSPAPRRQIELLQEYRTRLIADVVTGKLDVREAAAQLSR